MGPEPGQSPAPHKPPPARAVGLGEQGCGRPKEPGERQTQAAVRVAGGGRGATACPLHLATIPSAVRLTHGFHTMSLLKNPARFLIILKTNKQDAATETVATFNKRDGVSKHFFPTGDDRLQSK